MATVYTDLLDRVRQWSNRDAEALPNIVIQEGLRWSADTSYRELMVPPLEYTQQYVVIASDTDEPQTELESSIAQTVIINDVRTQQYSPPGNVQLPIPADATAFIQLRIIGAAVRVPTEDADDDDSNYNYAVLDNGCLELSQDVAQPGIVFNEKVDVRTYSDFTANVNSEAFWTRMQNDLLLSGFIAVNDVIELYYYRRLPALDARYRLALEDYNADLATPFSAFVDLTTVLDTEPTTQADVDVLGLDNPSLSPDDFFELNGMWYAGVHTDHWLRDNNERILIFGALAECFDYLADDAQAAKYRQKYVAEIAELNKEDKRRTSSGGNVQVHYNSILI